MPSTRQVTYSTRSQNISTYCCLEHSPGRHGVNIPRTVAAHSSPVQTPAAPRPSRGRRPTRGWLPISCWTSSASRGGTTRSNTRASVSGGKAGHRLGRGKTAAHQSFSRGDGPTIKSPLGRRTSAQAAQPVAKLPRSSPGESLLCGVGRSLRRAIIMLGRNVAHQCQCPWRTEGGGPGHLHLAETIAHCNARPVRN
jgi:hypothetical protein